MGGLLGADSSRVRTDTWGTARERETLAWLAKGIAGMSMFKVCAIEVLRADHMLEFVAIHNNPDAAQALLGVARSYEFMAPVYDCGQTYGDLTFVPSESRTPDSRELLETFGFMPSFEPINAEDAWQVDDMIVAKLHDEDGQLRAILHLDEPEDGHRPGPHDLDRLSETLQPAFAAVVTAVEHEDLLKRVWYADLTRKMIREFNDTMGMEELLEVASAQLCDGFDAERLTIYLRDALGFQLRMGRGGEISDDLYQAIGDSVDRAWGGGTLVIVEPGGVYGDDELAEHSAEFSRILQDEGIGTLVLVPVGAGGACLGSLVITRGPDSPRWTSSESEAAIDVGRDLGRAVLNARAHEKEHRLNAELRQLDEYRSQLISTLSHELKNPIGVIVGHLEMIESASETSPARLRSLQAIERGAARLDHLADDLLLLSRIGNPDNPPSWEPVDLAAVLTECAEFARVTGDGAGVEIVVEPPVGETVVEGDRTELGQVVTNLLSNAIKYTDPGGGVRLSARRQGRWVTVSCADSGLGISSEDQDRLFTEFFRSTNVEALTRPGTGLGLAILKRVVDRHGGKVTIASELGQGTTFLVTLPTQQARRRTVSAPRQRKATTSSTHRGTKSPARP